MNELRIARDPARIDPALMHRLQARESHRARGIDRATVGRSVRGGAAKGLYERTGFPTLAHPERRTERHFPHVYGAAP